MDPNLDWPYCARLVAAQLERNEIDIANLHLEMIEVKRDHAVWKGQAKIIGFFWTIGVLAFEYWVRR